MFSKLNFLRRTLALAGTATLIAASPSALAQGTASLSTGASCSYSSMTVQPNGTIQINCTTSTPPPPPANSAVFSLSGPTSMAVRNREYVNVARSGSSSEVLVIRLSVAGAGCNNGYADLTFAAGGASQDIPILTFDGGACNISLTVPNGHTASPGTLNVTVGSSTGGPPPIAGCAAPPLDVVPGSMNTFGSVDQLRLKSGQVAYYPVPAAPNPASSVVIEFTQGQQPALPSGTVVTEFTVSKCPGVIDTGAAQCYYRSSPNQVNSNKIGIYTQPIPQYGWVDQQSIGDRGCYAPADAGQYYVSVRWSFLTCVYGVGQCGFSMQWAQGSNW